LTIYLDGLERSGNVFLNNAIQRSINVETISLRTHLVSTLKDYKEDYPFIVPVRNAFDAIASAKVYRDYVHNNHMYGDNNPAQSQIWVIIEKHQEYIDYLIDSPKFFIAPFHCFIEDHNETVRKMVKFYDPYFKDKIIKNFTKEEILLTTTDPAQSHSFSQEAFHPALGNFPRNKDKNRIKVEEIILKDYSKKIHELQKRQEVLFQRYYDIEA
jgi:hypothetical protein